MDRMSNSQQSFIRIVAIRQPAVVFEPQAWRPPLNVYESEQGIQLVAELAGVNLEDLRLQVQPKKVTIEGFRQILTRPAMLRIHRLEIVDGPFQVEVPLAVPVDPDHTEAQYVNGLLDVWLPFAQQAGQQSVVIRLRDGGAR